MSQGNMYPLSVKQWNPFVGCKFDCVYCKTSFQAQAKRQKHNCIKCYNFEPHFHPERLNQPLPKTEYMQFIFTCSMGDISFCSTEDFEKIIERIRKEKDKTFLLQSKNPKTFERVELPNNLIIGTTIESNYNTYKSEAPFTFQRYVDMNHLKHSLKMITIEPVLRFDSEIIINWIRDINPVMAWLGYDSKNNHLPEPSLADVQKLHWELSKLGIPVFLKTIRKAWWEK